MPDSIQQPPELAVNLSDLAKNWLEKHINKPTVEGKLTNPSPPPGIAKSILETISHPVATSIAGPALALKDAVQSFGANILNGIQALSPTPIPGATDPYYGSKNEPNLGWAAADRFGALTSALMLGLPKMLGARISKEYQDTPGETTHTEDIKNILAGARDFIAKDLLPGSEAEQIIHGHVQTGEDSNGNPIYRPITGSDVGRLTTLGALKLLMADQTIGKMGLKGGLGEGAKFSQLTPSAETLRKVYTTGELEQAGVLLDKLKTRGVASKVIDKVERILDKPNTPSDAIDAVNTATKKINKAANKIANDTTAGPSEQFPQPPAGPPTLPADVIDEVQQSLPASQAIANETNRMLSNAQVRETVARASQSNITLDVLNQSKKLSENNINHYEIVARAIERGALQDVGQLSTDLAERHGLPIQDINSWVANEVRSFASESGENLRTFGESADMFEGALLTRSQAGDAKAMEALRKLKKNSELQYPGVNNWSKLYTYMVQQSNKGVERLRLGMLIGRPVTGLRNAVQQMGAGGIMDLVENGIGGIINTVVEGKKGSGASSAQLFGDMLSDVGQVWAHLTTDGRASLEDLLRKFPKVKDELEQAPSSLAYDTRLGLLQNWRKGLKPQGLDEWMGVTSSIGSIINNSQEALSRKLFFRTRLDANLKALGEGHSWDTLNAAAKTGELPTQYREIVGDALEHAMKNTFAYEPSGSPMAVILNIMRKYVPMHTALVTPFPRFMANALRYNLERSPTLLFNMFDPAFRDTLYQGLDGGLKSANARRQLARGMEGYLMLNGAYFIRETMGGPKFWQINQGTKDENGNPEYLDTRNLHPQSGWLALGHIIERTSKNQPLEMTNDDWATALLGLRKISKDVPITGLADFLQSEDSLNPDTREKAFDRMVGNYLGGFFVPVQTLNDAFGTFWKKDFLYQRDTTGDPIFGPAMANIPGLNLDLPVRYNAYTGKPSKSEEPIAHFYTHLKQGENVFKSVQEATPGMGIRGQPDLQGVIERIPGMSIDQLIGAKVGDPIADNSIRKWFGVITGTKMANGQSLGDSIAKMITNGNYEPTTQKFLLEKIFGADGPIHNIVKTAAQGEHPEAFIKSEVQQRLPIGKLKELVGKELRKHPLTK